MKNTHGLFVCFITISMIVATILQITSLPLSACDPEPGPQHFPPPSMPPTIFKTGCFELHSTRTGLPSNHIRSVLALEDIVLAGSEGDGLMIFKDAAWHAYTPESSPSFPSRTVTALTRGEEGKILAATPDGLVSIDISSGLQFERLTVPDPGGTNILSVVQAGQKIWVGTDFKAGFISGSNLIPCKVDGERQPTGFGSVVAQGETVWFGSSVGLYQAREGILTPAYLGNFDQGWVCGLAAVGDWLLAATSNGLLAKKGENVVEVVPGIWTTCISAPSDAMPALEAALGEAKQDSATSNELAYLTNPTQETIDIFNRMTSEYQRIKNLYASGRAPTWDELNSYTTEMSRLEQQVSIATAPLQRGIWVGTQDQGAFLLGMDGERSRLTSDNSKLPENRITCISTCDNGETWIGTFESGLLHYKQYKTTQKPLPIDVWLGKAVTMSVIDKNLYIGTQDQGLVAFDVDTLEQTGAWTPNQPNGFHSKVTDIALDSKGRIWVGGNAGIWMQDESGWHKFSVLQGIPSEEISCIETDSEGRVYIAGAGEGRLSRQLAAYDGEKFLSYDITTLKAAVSRPDGSSLLKALQMNGGYQSSFNAANATQALAVYDPNPSEAPITTMLGTPYYLLIGVANGRLYLFDGEAFKPVSPKGCGELKKIAGLARLPEGTLVILGKNACLTFDGQTFTPTLPMPVDFKEFTSLALDQKNPQLFWVSFSSGDGGGWALYQNQSWSVHNHTTPVKQIVLSDPFGFLLTSEGVFRILLS